MKIIAADYTYIDGEYKKDYAVAFEKEIVSVAVYEEIIEQYPDAQLIEQIPHTILYPGFINTHVHLEFSTNRTTLEYGSFIPWLYSVIEDRNQLAETCTTEIMLEACRSMLKSGITAFGAISSMGLDLDASIAAPQHVILFNELIGSNPDTADKAYESFLKRYRASEGHSGERVTAAIAVHSPYSVQPSILKKAVALAKSEGALLSTHFLESQAERQWLDHSEGEFKSFFESFFNQNRALTTVEEYLSIFDGYPTHFAHCVQATEKELEKIASQRHTIAHCPRSNRLLGCGRLGIERVEALDIPYSLATDGLSSNDSLNLFDELRAAVMLHSELELKALSKRLIRSITSDAAKILNLKSGRITKGYKADFAIIQLPEKPKLEKELALWTILHTREAKQLFIEGEQYL